MSRTPALMVLGTGSSVGKSLIVAALCRIFANRGIAVAPFKAQNMSLNSAATPQGHEIGRAQAMQAQAARRPPTVDMNPILLKPTSDRRAQVIVDGAILHDADAWDYYRRQTAELFPRVMAAYGRLADTSELIVLEGAGSPAEINLRSGDIVNMRMAHAAQASCLLVGDIDRGGVFASLLGTLELLEGPDRARIHSYAINKFRGDIALLEPGIAMIDPRLGIPCAGVIPWIPALGLEDEDGYGAFADRGKWSVRRDDARPLRTAVIAFPYLSNATDFDALAAEPSVEIRLVDRADMLDEADLIVLPGTKSTLHDLAWLRARGLERAIDRHARHKPTIGICGGMQMLGLHIEDRHDIEGGGDALGLGLLPLQTSLDRLKVTRVRSARIATSTLFGQPARPIAFEGYEIHVGATTGARRAPFAHLEDGTSDGAISADGWTLGTYLHGLFDDDGVRHMLLDAARAACGLAVAASRCDYTAERDARFERLADIVANALDIDALLARVGVTPANL